MSKHTTRVRFYFTAAELHLLQTARAAGVRKRVLHTALATALVQAIPLLPAGKRRKATKGVHVRRESLAADAAKGVARTLFRMWLPTPLAQELARVKAAARAASVRKETLYALQHKAIGELVIQLRQA